MCNQDEIEGCITISACNYNDLATNDDGSCFYAEAQYNCDGECLFDFDSDGVCDIYEVLGCTDSDYVEYDEFATEENGSCQTLIVVGCLDDSYLEYDTGANVNNLSLCITPIVFGCMDSFACNYNSEANTSDGSCEIIDGICDLCQDGVIVDNDEDDDGVCNSDEIIGCTDALACNYDATPTTDTDNSLCNYSTDLDECATCSGETDGTGIIIDNDFDDDGVCDEVDYDDGIGIDELSQDRPTLIRMIDILGAEHVVHPRGKLMFYIYSDRSVKKQIRY